MPSRATALLEVGQPTSSRDSTKPHRATKPTKIRDVKFPPASTSSRIDPRAMSGAEIEQKENPGLPGLKSKTQISNRDVRSLFPVSQRIALRE
jgi:hypothetical protein